MNYKEIPYYVSGIYRILFNDTSKYYIGLSNNIRRRMTEHCRKDILEHPDLPLSKAIVKHGIKDVEILEYIPASDRDRLCDREKYWIQYYKSLVFENGYNISKGGDGANSGTDNNASNITQEELNNIVLLLKNTKMSYREIGEKFSMCSEAIGRINRGEHYYNESLVYPIRVDHTHFGFENPTSAFYHNEQKLFSIVQTIKDCPEKDLALIAQEFNIGKNLITQINNGHIYKIDGENYPIRKNARSHKRWFVKKELDQIYDDLKNSSLTMSEIGKKFACDRKVISNLNNGKRQPQSSIDYPIGNSKKGIKSKPNPVQTISESGE